MSERVRNVLAGLLTLAVFSSVLVLAARADGREATRATSNDGGAWLVDRSQGKLAHVEYTTRELTSDVAAFDQGAEASALQADGIVLVHERTTSSVRVIDGAGAERLSTTSVPLGAVVKPRTKGAVVFEPKTSRLWDLDIGDLAAEDLDEVSPRFVGGSPGELLVSRTGEIAVVTETSVVWPSADEGSDPQVFDLPPGLEPRHVSMASMQAVVVGQNGDWFVSTASGGSTVTLERPLEVQHIQRESAEWPLVGVVSPAGQAFLVDVTDGSVIELATEENRRVRVSSPPIYHEGCLHTLGGESGALDFWALCKTGEIVPSTSTAPADAELRLVNGKVWVDALDGSGSVMSPDLALQDIEDFSDLLDDDDEGDETSDGNNIEERLDQASETAGLTDSDKLDNDDVNDPPIAQDDEAATRLGRAVIVDVLGNDSDPDGDVILVGDVTVLDGADLAQVRVPTSANSIQVSPNALPGTVRFRYEISDGNGLTDTAVVTVEILPVSQENNRPPTAVLDRVKGAAGATVTVNLLENDFDADGDSFSLAEIADGQGVTVLSSHPDGTVVLQLPASVDTAQIELPYLLQDEWQAEQEGILRIVLRLDDSNSPPDASNDAGTTQVGRTLRLLLLDNDVDPDNDLLVVGKKPQSVNGQPVPGFVSTTDDGEFVFRPTEAGTFIFEYSATDRRESDSALVRVEVTEAEENRAPVAVRDDVTLAIGENRLVRALENDGDADGDLIGVVQINPNDNLDIAVVDGVGFTVSMKPSASTVELFSYAVSDGELRSDVTQVVVNRSQRPFQNAAPVANDDSIRVRAGRTSRLFVLRNDFDPEGMPLTIATAQGPTETSEDGEIPANPGGNGRWVDVQVPLDQVFPFSVQYTVEDVEGLVDAASVQVVVVGPDEPNSAPIARPDVAYTIEGTPIGVNVLSNDSDPESDGLSLGASPSPPSGGFIVPNDTGTGFIYTPTPGFLGTDEFTYIVRDTEGAESVGFVNVGVMPIPEQNRPPVAGDDFEIGVFEADGSVVTLDVRVNDTDPDNDPTTIVEVRSNDGRAKISESGKFIQFELPASVGEEQIFTFSYVIDDGRLGQDDAEVSVIVQPVVEPIPPVATPDVGGPIAQGETAAFDVLDNDRDANGSSATLRLVAIDPPSAGVIDGREIVVTAGAESVEIGYTIEDEQGLQASSTLTVEVKENLPPVIDPAVIVLPETNSDVPIPQIDLSQYVSDPDNTLDELVFAGVGGAVGGTTTLVEGARDSRLVVFTASDDFRGEAGFSFTVQDPAGNLVSGRVSIQLLGTSNQPPVGSDTEATLEAGKVLLFDARTLFTDPDGPDGLVYELERAPQGGLVLDGVAPDLQLSIPITAAGAETSFVIRVTDPEGETATATVSVTVEETSVGAPEAGVVAAPEINQGEQVALDVLAAATNTLGEGSLRLLSATVLTDNAGSANVEGGTVNYQSDPNFSGTATIEYVIADDRQGDGGEAIGNVDVIVVGRPEAPSGVVAEAQGPNTVTITWRVPDDNGGPIEGYRVRLNGGDVRDHNSIQPFVTYDDLVAGDAYTFEVIARNKAGESVLSQPSNEVTPDEKPGPPGTPTATFVLGTPGAILVQWSASPNRGSAIENYIVEVTGCATGTTPVGTALERLWTGLPDGQQCSFSVKSENKAGESPVSGQSNQECSVSEPTQPATPSAIRGDKQAEVSWSAPGNPDCEPIQSYEIVRYLNGAVDGTTPVPFGTNNWTSSPLLNGESYSFAVRAQNRQGWGQESARSPEVTPCGEPEAPPAPNVEPGDERITITHDAAPANGCVVEQYVVRVNGGAQQQLPPDGRIGGLTNGTPYTVEVAGVNEIGVGDFSPASAAATPFGVPFPPTRLFQPEFVGFRYGNADNNGSPITSYEFSGSGELQARDTNSINVYCINNLGRRCVFAGDAGSQAPPTGCLQNSQNWLMEFWAVNAAGPGERVTQQWSLGGCPSAPSLSVNGGNGQFSASWSRPAGTTHIYIQVDNSYGSPRSGTSTTISATNGRTYSVTAWACNDFGCAKSATRSVRPEAPAPSLSLGRGGDFVGGSCGTNSGCEYITGSGSNFTPNSEFWVQCGDFVDTQANDPIVYRDRFVDGSGNLSWGDGICGNNFSTTVRVWTSAGDDVSRTVGAP